MSNPMSVRVGSLFTGGGGLDMAVHALFPDAETVWCSEVDKAPSRLLSVRLADVPNLGDITAINWHDVEPVDVLVGGFPCQDISHAGKRAGITKETRSGLWFYFADAIRVLRPRLVLAENVAAITALAGAHDAVLGELADLGFDAEWGVLRASDVGASHQRARWFLAAWPTDSDLAGLEGRHPGSVRERGTERPAGPGDPHDLSLLPTPRPQTKGGGGSPDRTWHLRDCGGPNLATALAMLPTPAAHEPGGTVEQYHARLRAHDGRSSSFTPLGMLVQNLPTPTAPDPRGDRNATSGRSNLDSEHHSGTTLNDVAYAEQWGDYAPAIARWEAILGRPAPDSTDAKRRLSPAFVEWMMGWPEGWVDLDGLSRANRLKILGNGVVPQQAAAAYRQLLARARQLEVAA